MNRGALVAILLGLACAAAPMGAASLDPVSHAGASTQGPANRNAPAEGAGRLALPEAVQRALSQFPALGVTRAHLEGARASRREAASALWPSLRLAATGTRSQEPMLVTPLHGFDLRRIPEFDRTLLQGSLSLAYTFFDGGTRRARLRQAGAQSAAAEAGLDAAQQSLVASVVNTYLDVLSQARVLEAHDVRLQALERERLRVRQLLAAGRAAQVDLLRVEAALARAQAERVRLAAGLDDAECDLARLVGARDVRAADLDSVALADLRIAAQDSLLAAAQQASPALAQARGGLAQSEAAVAMARGALWPELSLVGNWVDRGSAKGDFTDEWNAGLQLSYTLFSGGAVRSGIARAEAARRGASESLRLAELQLQQQLEHALHAVGEAHALVLSLETAVQRFAEVVRIERLLLDVGSGTEIDYLDAEAELLAARASLVRARHGEIAARAELARASGRLDLAWLERNLEVQP